MPLSPAARAVPVMNGGLVSLFQMMRPSFKSSVLELISASHFEHADRVFLSEMLDLVSGIQAAAP